MIPAQLPCVARVGAVNVAAGRPALLPHRAQPRALAAAALPLPTLNPTLPGAVRLCAYVQRPEKDVVAPNYLHSIWVEPKTYDKVG